MNEIQNRESNNNALKNLRVLRQAFGLAAILILTGLAGAYFINAYFLILPLMVSGGLLFSSIVGWCPMIHILERMPWNR